MSYKPTISSLALGQYYLSKSSGHLNTNDYLTFNAISALSGASINADELTLPKGQYLIECSLAADRTNGYYSKCEYRIELGGSLVGTVGAMDYYSSQTVGNISCDSASAEFEISQSTVLKIKITDATLNETTASTSSTHDYSSLLIRRRY